jgi:CheY-like chemotaxis protein
MNEPAGASGTVLIADDDPMTRALVRGSLEQLGYKVEEAADGAETLEALSQYKPDILLLDIKMPGMDGIETLKKLRKRPDGKDQQRPPPPAPQIMSPSQSTGACLASASGTSFT